MPVWNSELHSLYETEIAQWWEGQRETLVNTGSVVASWSMGNLHPLFGWPLDLGPNNLSMAIPGNATIITSSTPHYLQFTTSNVDSVQSEYNIDGAITLGGWFSVDASQSGVKGLISNGLATFSPSTHHYGLIWNGNQPQFAINNTTGSSYETVTAVSSPNIGSWFHIVGRFTPGAEIAIFINDQKTTAATTITSTANSNGQTIGVGQLGAGYGRLTSGKCQRAWILNTALPDKDIAFIYQNQRHLFGV